MFGLKSLHLNVLIVYMSLKLKCAQITADTIWMKRNISDETLRIADASTERTNEKPIYRNFKQG